MRETQGFGFAATIADAGGLVTDGPAAVHGAPASTRATTEYRLDDASPKLEFYQILTAGKSKDEA
jgi:hypothetical protein